MKIILTGATGMVGEGVLIECMAHPLIEEILCVCRRTSGVQHLKVKEYIVPEFLNLVDDDEHLREYDACFFCSGASSVGISEQDFTRITYDTTLHFASVVLKLNPGLIFCYISGKGTDSTELSKTLRHRVKGQTENALKQMSFRHQYSFRPGLMKPTEGQKNYTNRLYKPLYMFLHVFYDTCTIKQVGLSMINTALYGYPQNILEISDIIIASQQQGDSQKIEEHSGEIQDDQIANS